MLLGDTHHLCHLRLGYFEIVNAAYTLALRMYLQHDLGGTRAFHSENRLQNVHDEFHRRVVIVDEHHAVKGWLLELWTSLLDGKLVAVNTFLIGSLLTHQSPGLLIASLCHEFDHLVADAGYYIWALRGDLQAWFTDLLPPRPAGAIDYVQKSHLYHCQI